LGGRIAARASYVLTGPAGPAGRPSARGNGPGWTFVAGLGPLLGLSRLHNDEVCDRSIDVQVGRLRRKLEQAGAQAPLIRTERGAGYVFLAAVEVVR
jgi:Transcriptional regulatory protein, C terminal